MLNKMRKTSAYTWTYLIVLATFVAAASCTAATPTVKQGLDAINDNRYQDAYNILKPLAVSGNAEAQERFGLLFFSDPGENPYFDSEKGYYWQRKSAEAGYFYAQFTLGFQLSKDASKFDRETRYKMRKEAYQWYLKAAEQGYSFAQIEVGKFLSQGKYVDRDRAKAYMWYTLAANGGKPIDSNGPPVSGFGASAQKNIMNYMTPEEIQKGKELVKKWYESHSAK